MNKKIIVVCGPTAVGKTKFAIEIAKKFNGEIVSSDSMQLYKYMDIGSAKPTLDEQKQAVHHLIDCIDPKEDFSVAKYKVMAEEAIDDILQRDHVPVIAGGTGLYVNSIIYDMDFAAPPEDEELREELYKEAEKFGPEFIHNKLAELDEDAAKRIHPNNVKKVVRAIESAKLGNKVRDFSKDLRKNTKYDPILVCLDRNRPELYDRINKRVDILFNEGLVDEVKHLSEMGLKEANISMKGIGYKEVFQYLNGEITLEESKELIKRNTRRFAKRQLTWFRKYEDMKWFNISEFVNDEDALEAIFSWVQSEL